MAILGKQNLLQSAPLKQYFLKKSDVAYVMPDGGRQLAIKNWLLLLPSSEINNSMSLNELDPLFLYMFTREDSHFCVTPTFIPKLVISLSLH